MSKIASVYLEESFIPENIVGGGECNGIREIRTSYPIEQKLMIVDERIREEHRWWQSILTVYSRCDVSKLVKSRPVKTDKIPIYQVPETKRIPQAVHDHIF